jgi:hypothetical protein
MEKLLVIATLGRKAYSKWLFQRMIARAITLMGIIFIIAILLSALLIVLLYVSYMAFLEGGLTPPMAILVVSMLALIIIGLLGKLAHNCALDLPRMLAPQSPIASRISDLFDAFMDGFKEK